MEKTTEQNVYRTEIIDGEIQEILDYMIKRIHRFEVITEGGVQKEQLTLLKTEHVYENGDIYLVTEGDGYISRMKVISAEEELEKSKAARIVKLWKDCNNDILSGFVSAAGGATPEGTLWGFDEQDQANLNQMLTAIVAGIAIAPISWKPKGEAAPFSLTFDQFKALCVDAQAAKITKIQREWQIKAAIQACTAPEDVLNHTW